MPSMREKDFVSFFNGFWYRDFPTIETFEDVGRRAVWTSHIASVVKRCADMMGAFTCYETGNRTDAVIQLIDQDAPGERITWAKAEWEWGQAHRENVNEITKLAEACQANTCNVAVFVGFCRSSNLEITKTTILNKWNNVNSPLICFIIDFEIQSKLRRFNKLHTFRYSKNRENTVSIKRLRPPQAALPWDVGGTRWNADRKIEKDNVA